jgi:hypothetical protein
MRKAIALTLLAMLSVAGVASAGIITLDGDIDDWGMGGPFAVAEDPPGDVFGQAREEAVSSVTFRSHMDIVRTRAVTQDGWLYVLLEYADVVFTIAGDEAACCGTEVFISSAEDGLFGMSGEDIGEDKAEYTKWDEPGQELATGATTLWAAFRAMDDAELSDLSTGNVDSVDSAPYNIIDTTGVGAGGDPDTTVSTRVLVDAKVQAAADLLIEYYTVPNGAGGVTAHARNVVPGADSGFVTYLTSNGTSLKKTDRYWRRYDDLGIDWDNDVETGDDPTILEETPMTANIGGVAIGADTFFAGQFRSESDGAFRVKSSYIDGLGVDVPVIRFEDNDDPAGRTGVIIDRRVALEAWKGHNREIGIPLVNLASWAKLNGFDAPSDGQVIGIQMGSDGTPWDRGMEAAAPVYVTLHISGPLPVAPSTWGSVKSLFSE